MSNRLRLKADDLSCERGGRLVFKNLNFELASGELAELRGPNGSGKSSLLRLLAGLNESSSGQLTFESGIDELTLAEQSHYIGHSEACKPALTVFENLDFWAYMLGTPFEPASLSAFNLEPLADDQVLYLSHGQKRRLALTRLIIAKRQVWLLDEPMVGLDATSQSLMQKQIQIHLSNGGIVIAATHTELGLAVAQTIELGGTTL